MLTRTQRVQAQSVIRIFVKVAVQDTCINRRSYRGGKAKVLQGIPRPCVINNQNASKTLVNRTGWIGFTPVGQIWIRVIDVCCSWIDNHTFYRWHNSWRTDTASVETKDLEAVRSSRKHTFKRDCRTISATRHSPCTWSTKSLAVFTNCTLQPEWIIPLRK